MGQEVYWNFLWPEKINTQDILSRVTHAFMHASLLLTPQLLICMNDSDSSHLHSIQLTGNFLRVHCACMETAVRYLVHQSVATCTVSAACSVIGYAWRNAARHIVQYIDESFYSELRT